MTNCQAIVDEVTPLTDSIFKVYLKPQTPFLYEAGQYLEVVTPYGQFPFSIANAPLGQGKIELHIRHANDNELNQWLLKTIKEVGRLTIQVAKGQCRVALLAPSHPILFIAGGTGFAPIKAMIEQLLFEGDKRQMHFCWLANKKVDFYHDETVKQWAAHMPQFAYTPILSSRQQGKLGIDALLKSIYKTKASTFQAVLAGPFDLVFRLKDELLSLGINESLMHSDAFSYLNKS